MDRRGLGDAAPTIGVMVDVEVEAHRCIGAEFARQQAKVFIYHLLTRYPVERVHPGRSAWARVPLPAPRDGLPIRINPR